MVYGRVEENRAVMSTRRISFCPRCNSYIAPHFKCRNCGYKLEEYLVIQSKLLRRQWLERAMLFKIELSLTKFDFVEIRVRPCRLE